MLSNAEILKTSITKIMYCIFIQNKRSENSPNENMSGMARTVKSIVSECKTPMETKDQKKYHILPYLLHALEDIWYKKMY